MSIHDFVNKHSRMASAILSKSSRVRRLRKLAERPRLAELKKMEDEIDPPPKPEPRSVVEPKETAPKKTPVKTTRKRRKKSLDNN